MAYSPTILAMLAVYLLILLAIGIWSRSDSRSIAGYYVADKRLPSWIIAFSSNATGESAWLLLGLTGMGYLIGIHAFWVVLGEVLGVTLAWVFIARPFKEYTDRFGSITVPDFLEDRFADKRRIIRRLSAIVIFSMVAVYTAAQLTASGKAFQSFLGTTYESGVLIGTAVVLCYTAIGGFKAVAYSDFLQGILMLGCLIVLPLAGVAAAGGWMAMLDQLHAIDPGLLLPMGEFGLSAAGVASALSLAAVGLAFLGVPQLLTRFISARSPAEIAPAGFIAVIVIIIFDTGAVLAGLAGRVLYPALADAETVMPAMSVDLLPELLTGVCLVAVLAAIMSTVDSLLILASSAVVRDVIQKIYNPFLSDRRLSIYGKITTIALGLGALAVALTETRVIFWFVLFAWSGLASAFVPVTLTALFWKKTTLPGALAGMIGGFATAVLWVLLFKAQFYDIYEMLPGVLVGLALTILVSLFTSAPPGAQREFASIKKAVGNPFKKR